MRIKSPLGNDEISEYKEVKEQKHSRNIKGFFSEVFDWIKTAFILIASVTCLILIACSIITIGLLIIKLFGNAWFFITSGKLENYLFNTVIPFITSEDFFAGFIIFGFLYETHYLIHGLIKLLYKEHNEYAKNEDDKI